VSVRLVVRVYGPLLLVVDTVCPGLDIPEVDKMGGQAPPPYGAVRILLG